MTDVLSPQEIAKLFAAAEEGKLPEPAHAHARRSQSIRKMNFGVPMILSLAEQRRFELAHTRYCSDVSARLSSELRAPIELEVINSSQLTWGAALGQIPQPSILGRVKCAPGEITMLMCVEESLVLRMIERLLGGSYADTPTPRALTEIDVVLAHEVFEWLLTPLSSVWQGLLGLSLGLVEVESPEKSVELMPATEPTIELTVEVRDESTSSTLSLLVPHAAIKVATKSLSSKVPGSPDERAEDGARAMRSALGGVRLEVRAEAGAAGLTIREVMSLGEGDVVRLGAAGSTYIVAGENRLHRARPGLSGRRRAVQIVEPLERCA